MTVFDLLVWSGAIVSAAGLCGLVWCILFVSRARRQNVPDEEMRARLRKAVPINLGAVFLSVFGLMLVSLGVFMG